VNIQPGPIHLAIIHRRFLRMILDGSKTAEARLSKTRRLPYKGLEQGQAIYLKPPGGVILGQAIAGAVHRFELASPSDVAGLKARFAGPLGGPDPASDEYWAGKADAVYATIIELVNVEQIAQPAWYQPQNNRSAWRLVRPA